MNGYELGHVLVALLILMVSANLLGHLFAKFRQPKVVGEIEAGILLGPTLLGNLAPGFVSNIFGGKNDPESTAMTFFYNFGMLMLMFVAGATAKHLLGKENRRATGIILGIGTTMPFILALLVAPVLPLHRFVGVAGSENALILVFACAAAVTSIPVITKIFSDLGILHTRFASLQLGSAVLEDIGLWGVLSIASAIAANNLSQKSGELSSSIGDHILYNGIFIAVALAVMPAVLRKLSRARWNVIAQQSPVAWMLAVFLGYVGLASAMNVTTAFAALLAGYGIMGGMKSTEQAYFAAPMRSIADLAHTMFIPVYFALIGFKLDLAQTLNPVMLILFMLGTSAAVFLCVGLAGKFAGFSRLDLINLAITQNARGGPGIVMATVTYQAGIINVEFFTTLILTAVLTSQACGFWLDYVLRKGWPLLSNQDLRRRGLDSEPEIEQLPQHTPTLVGVGTSTNGHGNGNGNGHGHVSSQPVDVLN
jgi:Kef-type K+ transport system membrane component KefB